MFNWLSHELATQLMRERMAEAAAEVRAHELRAAARDYAAAARDDAGAPATAHPAPAADHRPKDATSHAGHAAPSRPRRPARLRMHLARGLRRVALRLDPSLIAAAAPSAIHR